MVQKNKLLEKLTHLKRGKVFNQGWTEESPRPRDSEEIYRRRWQHDRIVRSTHGVNCRQIILGAVEGIVITDRNGIIQDVNPSFTETFGFSAEEVRGKTPKVLRSGKHDQQFFKEMWESIEKLGFWEGNIWNKDKDGNLKHELLTISHVTNNAGEIKYYVGRYYDSNE